MRLPTRTQWSDPQEGHAGGPCRDVMRLAWAPNTSWATPPQYVHRKGTGPSPDMGSEWRSMRITPRDRDDPTAQKPLFPAPFCSVNVPGASFFNPVAPPVTTTLSSVAEPWASEAIQMPAVP